MLHSLITQKYWQSVLLSYVSTCKQWKYDQRMTKK
jgi:hypothetical protein